MAASGKEESTPPRRYNAMRRLDAPIGRLVRPVAARKGLAAAEIMLRWPEIVGVDWARRALPLALRFPPHRTREGVLEVLVSGADAPVLQHNAPWLIERLNSYFGYKAVGRLRLKQGVVPELDGRTSHTRRTGSAALPPLPAEQRNRLEDIDDPALRAALESFGRHILAGRRQNKR